jgi:hypothetical protein
MAGGGNPFDPGLARYRVRELPLDRIVDLLQVTHDPQTVAVFRQAMLEGAKFPPISVVPLGGRCVVSDGHKRLTAYSSLWAGPMVVEVWPLWRLGVELSRQLLRSFRRCLHIAVRAPWTREARGEARRMVRDTAFHWRRIANSLLARLRGSL